MNIITVASLLIASALVIVIYSRIALYRQCKSLTHHTNDEDSPCIIKWRDSSLEEKASKEAHVSKR